MANSDKVEWRLYDTDLITVLRVLSTKEQDLLLQLNEPGSGQVKIQLDSASAGDVASGMFLEVSYRGAVRGGFFVENITTDDVNGEENAGRMMTISGRGSLALLDDAIVWDDGTSATTRVFSAATQADILITLIEEAKARGGLLNLEYDFSATLDSDGNAWDDSTPLTFNVGTSLLEVARKMAGNAIDFNILPDGSGDFVLSAYKDGLGSDKSSTIYFRVGVNCEEISSLEAGSEIRNVLRVKYSEGFTTVKDAASITARRRREALIDAAYAGNSQVALTFGQADLETKKAPKNSITVKVYDGQGPRAFVDYGPGDTITLDRNGVEASYRVRGLSPSWDGDDYADITLDLNSIHLENEIRMGQDVAWLKNVWETAHDANLLDVATWMEFGQPDGIIWAIKVVGTKIYIGGGFETIGGITAPGIAVYDVATGSWSPLGTGISHTSYAIGVAKVEAIESIGTDIYITGLFTHVDGVATGAIAKWDGAAISAVGTTSGFEGHALAVIGTDLYVGKNSTLINAIANTAFLAKCDTTGPTWSSIGVLNSEVHALHVVGSDLYVGGTFSLAGGVANTSGTALYDGSWHAMGLGQGVTRTCFAMTAVGDYLYCSTGSGGVVGVADTAHLARWNMIDSVWESIGVFDGVVRALANDGINVYAAGAFALIDDIEVNRVAGWNGGSWFALVGGIATGGTGYAVAVYGVDIYVGGNISAIDSKAISNLGVYVTSFNSLVDHLSDSSYDLGAGIHGATETATLSNADEFPIWKSSTTLLGKITWANIKTYFAPATQTANRILVSDSTGAVTTTPSLAYDADGQIIHGGTAGALPTALGGTPTNYEHQIGADGASVGKYIWAFSNTLTHSPFIQFVRGGGAQAAPTKVLSGMELGEIRARGYYDTGSAFISGIQGRFLPIAGGDWASGDTPVNWEIYGTPVGSSTEQLLQRWYGSGNTEIYGKLTLPTNNIVITAGNLSLATYTQANTKILVNYPITADPSASAYSLYVQLGIDAGGTSITKATYGAYYNIYTSASQSANVTGDVTAQRNVVIHNGSGTVSNAVGVYITINNAGAGSISNAYGLLVNTWNGGGTTSYGAVINTNTTAAGTNKYGLYIGNVSGAATLNHAIYTNAGLNRFGDQVAIVGSADRDQLKVTGHTTQTNPLVYFIDNTSVTNAVRNVLKIETQSTNTAANGLGAGFLFSIETATNGTMQSAGLISASWVDATNASRKAKLSLSAYDTAVRLGMEIEASGSAAKLSFYGGTTVVLGAALTTQLTTITHTAPGTPDYVIQDLVNVGGYGFVTKDEGNTLLSVVKNLQTRVAEIDARLNGATGVKLWT